MSLSGSCSRDLLRAPCQGAGPTGPLAAYCAEDKLNRRWKKGIPYPISVQTLQMVFIATMHLKNDASPCVL